MADKGTLEAIEKLKAARPRALLVDIEAAGLGLSTREAWKAGVTSGLRFLVEDFRRQAELVMDSGARGKGATATALRSTASELSLLADAVEKVDLNGPAEVLPQPSRGGPTLPAEWCGSNEDHGPHDYPVPDGEGGDRYGYKYCIGHRPRDLTGLKELVADRAAMQRVTFDTEPTPEQMKVGPFVVPTRGLYGIGSDGTTVTTIVALHETADGGFTSDPIPAQPIRRDGEMEAWLSGESSTMPAIRNDGEPQQLAAPVPTFTEAQSVTFTEPRVNTPELKAEAASMFAEPAPIGAAAEPVMPGKRMSWADLRAAPAGPAPEHLSFSQGSTLDGCGTQYRLERLEPDVVQRPKWAAVGGTALHTAAEWFEKQALKAGIGSRGDYMRSRIEIAGGYAGVWKEHFAAALTEQVLRTPAVPPGDWKASGRGGAEGWTWWQVEGEAMLRRYLELRLVEMEAPERELLLEPLGDGAFVEHEGTLDVEGVPVKLVIDQVWRWGDGGGSLLIDDLKSGAYAPPGTYQLGLYAWHLRKTYGYDCEIWGRFWDARRGTFSEPVNLLEAHPWDEVVMRVHAQHSKKQLRLFNPNPDWGNCGKCTVKHACPAALTRG